MDFRWILFQSPIWSTCLFACSCFFAFCIVFSIVFPVFTVFFFREEIKILQTVDGPNMLQQYWRLQKKIRIKWSRWGRQMGNFTVDKCELGFPEFSLIVFFYWLVAFNFFLTNQNVSRVRELVVITLSLFHKYTTIVIKIDT